MSRLLNLFILWKAVPVLLRKFGVLAPVVTEYDDNGSLWDPNGPNASGAQVAPSIVIERPSDMQVGLAALSTFYALRELL